MKERVLCRWSWQSGRNYAGCGACCRRKAGWLEPAAGRGCCEGVQDGTFAVVFETVWSRGHTIEIRSNERDALIYFLGHGRREFQTQSRLRSNVAIGNTLSGLPPCLSVIAAGVSCSSVPGNQHFGRTWTVAWWVCIPILVDSSRAGDNASPHTYAYPPTTPRQLILVDSGTNGLEVTRVGGGRTRLMGLIVCGGSSGR